MHPKPTTHELSPHLLYEFYYSAQHEKNMHTLAATLGTEQPADYANEAWEWLKHPSTFKGQRYTVALGFGQVPAHNPPDRPVHLGFGTLADVRTTPQLIEEANAKTAVATAEAQLVAARARLSAATPR